jgi:SAM-dependent methyltransferase
MTTQAGPVFTEQYINGHAPAVLAFMQRRSLSNHGHFVEPLLARGQTLLDVGCGPGNLTLELAARIGGSGKVVGVDAHRAQFPPNPPVPFAAPVEFKTMDAYQLEFPAGTFDGVFSHALLEHLRRPLDFLSQAQRVLKVGGFVALRSPDWGGTVLNPYDDQIRAAFQARLALQQAAGGNVFAGRHLGEWLKQAGFGQVHVSASFEIYLDPQSIAEHLASQMKTRGDLENATAWHQWGQNPEALFAQAWFEATARKI